MKKFYAAAAGVIITIGALTTLMVYRSKAREEQFRYDREETQFILTNLSGANVALFKAGSTIDDAVAIAEFQPEGTWLPRGNYFLQVEEAGRTSFYPVSIFSYRGGPDKEGAFTVTIRPSRWQSPPQLHANLTEFVFIPSGHFLFGDHLRPSEPHYVWLTAYFMSVFEVTNAEFKEFIDDPSGYRNDANWTEAGRKWKATNVSHATTLLSPADADFKRFGQPDQPVVHVNWFEANAFCRWLTQKIGGGRWIFGLPSEAEWEKAARGPDNFDYSLGINISDEQVKLYNWKKNPTAEVTVVGWAETQRKYRRNRYGLYHMTGNVAEWTQSTYRTYNRQRPYVDDDDRNHDEVPGERVLRGGSWYTASIAVLYIPYRENFRPDVETPYLGFRIVARPIP
ncbi:MAG TPA: SUMF1/EgtB/PvdO family nonheme iron enzyme [Pyrinomonadaceae bacterium]|nr:SUMF1/EgtB/PvdO family nonheme iron enzyme [Pyrinomonadaceae bacterium]